MFPAITAADTAPPPGVVLHSGAPDAASSAYSTGPRGITAASPTAAGGALALKLRTSAPVAAARTSPTGTGGSSWPDWTAPRPANTSPSWSIGGSGGANDVQSLRAFQRTAPLARS